MSAADDENDLLRDPHVGNRTGSGDWVVNASKPSPFRGEDDIVGYLRGRNDSWLAKDRASAAIFNLGGALEAGYTVARQRGGIRDDWVANELPVKPARVSGVEGSTGRA